MSIEYNPSIKEIEALFETQRRKLTLLSFRDWFLSRPDDSKHYIIQLMEQWIYENRLYYTNGVYDPSLRLFINSISSYYKNRPNDVPWSYLLNTVNNTNFDTISAYLKMMMESYP